MLAWKPIDAQTLPLLEQYRPYSQGLSDYTPTSLLCYAAGMEIQYARSGPALLLKYREYDALEYALMPLNARDEDLLALRDDFAARSEPLRFDLLGKAAADQVGRVLGVELKRLTDCFDYIYTTENFLQLPGSEHATDRGKLNRLYRGHSVAYRSYTMADRDAVLDFCRAWVRDYVKPGAKYHFFAKAELRGLETVTAAFDRMPSTRGGVLAIDGVLSGFGFADHLDRDTCTLHNVKIRRDLPGVQLALIRSLLEREFPDKRYMNFEDDMGQPGLRIAKQRLRPCALLEKYSTGEYEQAAKGD